MGFAATDMDLVKPAAAERISWADLADSEDEGSGGTSSSWSRPARATTDVGGVRTACSEHLDTLEMNDDCSTDAPSDCAESPRLAWKIRFGDVVSEDDAAAEPRAQRAQPSCQSYQHGRWKDRWQDDEREDHWNHNRWWNNSWKSDDQWNDRWALKSDSQEEDQRYYAYGDRNSSWQTSPKKGTQSSSSAAPAKQNWGIYHAKEDAKRGARKGSAYKRFTTFRKPQCQFTIGIEEDAGFKVKAKLLGPHGKHMKVIADKTGAKMRLRGRGSGFKEGPEEQESDDPLMLCISALDNESYEAAKDLVQELLEDVYRQYHQYCGHSYRRAWPQLRIHLHEGPREGSA